MLPVTEDGRSGWQMCNLTEINGSKCDDKETFYRACKAAAIFGTLQAGYTDFKYVSKETKEITDREALLGVSITGWMNNPEVLFDEETMKEGARIVKETNKLVADLISINQAARTTCVKPSGNASVLLGTASGIHGEYAPMYFRNVQINKMDEVAQEILFINPEMTEESTWSTNGTDIVVSFPVTAKKNSIFREDLFGVKQLEYVKKAQMNWVEYGTNIELCTDPTLRHNVSNTISVNNWEEVEEYIYQNRKWFSGVSLLSMSGDKDYAQAPFTEVHGPAYILGLYGEGSMFASGLIVDAMHAFNNNLWLACDTLLGKGIDVSDDASDLLKRDWLRRAKKFSKNYLDNDILMLTYLLKDVYNLHKWYKINNSIQDIDFATILGSKSEIDVDTLGSQACAGGACEIRF